MRSCPGKVRCGPQAQPPLSIYNGDAPGSMTSGFWLLSVTERNNIEGTAPPPPAPELGPLWTKALQGDRQQTSATPNQEEYARRRYLSRTPKTLTGHRNQSPTPTGERERMGSGAGFPTLPHPPLSPKQCNTGMHCHKHFRHTAWVILSSPSGHWTFRNL